MNRADKLRAVAQQAHDNGDCVCCLSDHWRTYEGGCACGTSWPCPSAPITITISREDAKELFKQLIDSPNEGWYRRVFDTCKAALEGER